MSTNVTEEMLEALRRTPWVVLDSSQEARILCERCGSRIRNLDPEVIVNFSQQHEACPRKE